MMGYYGILRRIKKKVKINIESLCLKSDSSRSKAQRNLKKITENFKKYLTKGALCVILPMLPWLRDI